MPFVAALHIAIAIFFAVHAVRHGRNSYWLFVLLAFPLLGSAVYFFAEYLPELRHSRLARRAVGVVRAIVDPERDVRAAQLAFERTPTVDNRAWLAEALLRRGDTDQALQHYEHCASGAYANDVKFRLGLARAQIAAEQPAQAVIALESLFADQPERYRGEPALWYAKALAEVDESRAVAAFEQARQRHDSTETACAYGLYLARLGRDGQARVLFEEVLRNARLGTVQSRELNQVFIDQARAAVAALDERQTRRT